MPLLDHFHPSLLGGRGWESFQARWASAIADSLEEDLLPQGDFAEIQAHVGNRIELDVGAFDRDYLAVGVEESAETSSSVATLVAPAKVWTPPAADFYFPAIFPDVFEVLVYQGEGGSTLVAAIELVSPRDKDRPEARRAFAAKASSYLQAGVGLVIVDIVTSRPANLHDVLVDLPGPGEAYRMPGGPPV